jgi:hypothetical protein
MLVKFVMRQSLIAPEVLARSVAELLAEQYLNEDSDNLSEEKINELQKKVPANVWQEAEKTAVLLWIDKNRESVDRNFRDSFRKDLANASKRLQEWTNLLNGDLKRNFWKDAPPIIFSVFGEKASLELGEMADFGLNKQMQKDMQIAWVDRLEYLRFYYVQYKFPKLTGNELKKFAWDYLMTPQQYIEAIYRFGEKTGLPNEIVHAARVEMILKQDDEIQIDEKSMRENKQKLDKIVRLYQFAQEVYFKKLDYLTFARDALFVQFPLLKSYKDDTTYLD